MPELPPRWAAYARLQEELTNNSQLDDYAWGLEEGLNRLLKDDLSSEELDRVIRSRARRERNQNRLRRAYGLGEQHELGVAFVNELDIREQVDTLRRRVTASDWSILQMLGYGYGYGDIAALKMVTRGALRTRICRLRRRLREEDTRDK